jgi:hypothetical protein
MSNELDREARYAKVFDYANPYESDVYGKDPAGHGWDRLTAIAGEFARGEISWEQAVAWCDENARDLARVKDTTTCTCAAQYLDSAIHEAGCPAVKGDQ